MARAVGHPGKDPAGRTVPRKRHPVLGETGLDIKSATEDFENALIRQALHLSGGNKNRAATLLGLKRTTFVEMLKRRSLDAGCAPGTVS